MIFQVLSLGFVWAFVFLALEGLVGGMSDTEINDIEFEAIFQNVGLLPERIALVGHLKEIITTVSSFEESIQSLVTCCLRNVEIGYCAE